MTDVREVLRRWQAGESARSMADRKTAARYIAAAKCQEVDQSSVLTDEIVARVADDVQLRLPSQPSTAWNEIARHRAQIEAWLAGRRPLRLLSHSHHARAAQEWRGKVRGARELRSKLQRASHRCVSDDGWRQMVGLPLESCPSLSPDCRRPACGLGSSSTAPPPGARADLLRLDDLEKTVAATTDKRGEVRFGAPGPRRYMVAATYMVRAQPPVKGDWESLWSAFSFEIERGPVLPSPAK